MSSSSKLADSEAANIALAQKLIDLTRAAGADAASGQERFGRANVAQQRRSSSLRGSEVGTPWHARRRRRRQRRRHRADADGAGCCYYLVPVPVLRRGVASRATDARPDLYIYCTFGKCKLVFFRTCVDRYGGALAVLGMSENPRKPSFRSPNGLLAPFLA